MNSPEYTSLKTKIFGDNRLNFYLWIVTGSLVMGVSLWFIVLAMRVGMARSPTAIVGVAIYFVLLGHFGLTLQNYCARVAAAIDAHQSKNRDAKLQLEPAVEGRPTLSQVSERGPVVD